MTWVRSRDRGEVSAQIVVLTPLLILFVFLGVQSAIYFHAANVAAAAASQGAAAGSPVGAGADDAAAAATQTLADLGATSAATPSVSAGADFVRVTVEVAVAHIVPFFPDSVRRTAVEPKERFVPESER